MSKLEAAQMSVEGIAEGKWRGKTVKFMANAEAAPPRKRRTSIREVRQSVAAAACFRADGVKTSDHTFTKKSSIITALFSITK
jgi:hypothetical protein